MNPIGSDETCCDSCLNLPNNVKEWYFNRIISLGIYKTYESENYNNLPLNIISKLILLLKGKVKKNKKKVADFIADGFFQLLREFPFLFPDNSFILIPPKNDPSEKNQCSHVLNSFLRKLKTEGYSYTDLSSKISRLRDIGKNRDKNRDERFRDIERVHKLEEIDLENKTVLILDDVVTSKATAWDISRELKEKNAGEINILSMGRALLSSTGVMEQDIPNDMEFDELLIYFSNLDCIIEEDKIRKVSINSYSRTHEKIDCLTNEYLIELNFQNMTVKHYCRDFQQRRYLNKSFCKHITKLFLEIKDREGEIFALNRLNFIYQKLHEWDFICE